MMHVFSLQQALKTKIIVTDINNRYLDDNTKEEVIYDFLIKEPVVILSDLIRLFAVAIVFQSIVLLPDRIYRLRFFHYEHSSNHFCKFAIYRTYYFTTKLNRYYLILRRRD